MSHHRRVDQFAGELLALGLHLEFAVELRGAEFDAGEAQAL